MSPPGTVLAESGVAAMIERTAIDVPIGEVSMRKSTKRQANFVAVLMMKDRAGIRIDYIPSSAGIQNCFVLFDIFVYPYRDTLNI